MPTTHPREIHITLDGGKAAMTYNLSRASFEFLDAEGSPQHTLAHAGIHDNDLLRAAEDVLDALDILATDKRFKVEVS